MSGSGAFASIQFLVNGSPGDTSALTFTSAEINEGEIPDTVDHGFFTVTCAGAPNGTPCTDGEDVCTPVDTCQGGICVGTPLACDDGNPCTIDSCTPGVGCQNTPGNAGAVCRVASGQCDVAETCTGASAICPADAFASSVTTCTGASDNGACDARPIIAAGPRNTCIDVFQPSSFTCRGSAGQCDVGGDLHGIVGDLPGGRRSHRRRRPARGLRKAAACDATDHCSGTANTCIDEFQPSSVHVPCLGWPVRRRGDVHRDRRGSARRTASHRRPRPARGPRKAARATDTSDHCSGTANTCVDAFQAEQLHVPWLGGSVRRRGDLHRIVGASARPMGSRRPRRPAREPRRAAGCDDEPTTAAGPPTRASTCSSASSFTCRSSAGQCDVAETCTGSSGTCPTDVFASTATTCTGTSQGGGCDAADHCSGTANTCIDAFQASSFTCRGSAGQCDVAETCTGSSGICPADGLQSAATTCTGNSQGGGCDARRSLQRDRAIRASTSSSRARFTCRGSAGQCDVAETCTGSSGACPADGFAVVRDDLHRELARRRVRQLRRSLQRVAPTPAWTCSSPSTCSSAAPMPGSATSRRPARDRRVSARRTRSRRRRRPARELSTRRRQRRRRPLQRHRQHLRRRVPGRAASRAAARPVQCDVAETCTGIDGHRARRTCSRRPRRPARETSTGGAQRHGRPLQRNRQHLRRRVPGEQLHVPRLGRSVRRGGDLHGIVRDVPDGRVRIVGHDLHGNLAGRRLRHDRPLQRHRQHLRRRVPAEQLHLSRLGRSVRRRGDLHGIVGRLPGGRVRVVGDDLHGDVAGRRAATRPITAAAPPTPASTSFQPSSFTCRDSAGQCDVAETCTGSSGICPTDVFASSATTCTGTSQGGVCDSDRPLQRDRQHLRRRVPGEQLHVPRLGRPVRRRGDVHRIVGHLPGGRLRVVGDDLHGNVAGRRAATRPTTAAGPPTRAWTCSSRAASPAAARQVSATSRRRARDRRGSARRMRSRRRRRPARETSQGGGATRPTTAAAPPTRASTSSSRAASRAVARPVSATSRRRAPDRRGLARRTGSHHRPRPARELRKAARAMTTWPTTAAAPPIRASTSSSRTRFTCRGSAGQCDVAETCTGSSGTCPTDVFASRRRPARESPRRRVRRGRSLQRDRQHVRRCVPAEQLHLPWLDRSVRRRGDLHGIVGGVSVGPAGAQRHFVR